jgi:hypothetical protein
MKENDIGTQVLKNGITRFVNGPLSNAGQFSCSANAAFQGWQDTRLKSNSSAAPRPCGRTFY